MLWALTHGADTTLQALVQQAAQPYWFTVDSVMPPPFRRVRVLDRVSFCVTTSVVERVS